MVLDWKDRKCFSGLTNVGHSYWYITSINIFISSFLQWSCYSWRNT